MQNKISIAQAKQQISEGFSSIYSKDDVLHLLDCINTAIGLDKSVIDELSTDIAESLQSEGTYLIDDYDLTMSHKEVELDSIDFSESNIKNVVKDVLKNYINNNETE